MNPAHLHPWHSPSRSAYNAGMGTKAGLEVDAWLREGGMVVTASDRAARALRSAFHRARRAERLTAWPAPAILDWRSFVREAWTARAFDGRLLLNPAQEQSLWAEIAGRGRQPATLLDGPRHRLAALAMEAHELLATHAPQYLRPGTRSAWQQDAAVFSAWLTWFDETCRDGQLLSPSRLPLELITLLENKDAASRPPLLAAGFDRILPVQRSLFNAWSEWREPAAGEPATNVACYETADTHAELMTCAMWCKRHIAANANARLLVVTQDASTRRGEIERAFQRVLGSRTLPPFEFSLGIPLRRAPLAKGALLLLRWLRGSIEETEVDWLFSTGQVAGTAQESAALHRYMRELRRRSLQRTHWTLDAFCRQERAAQLLPPPWVQRMKDAQRRISISAAPQTPLDWAAMIPQILKDVGWPGLRPLASEEFQAAQRWQQAVEASGSLGFDGRRMSWQEFLSVLARILEDTLFAPESRDAPIQVAGPAESAGLTADAIWFLGADEDAWPAGGATHPFLPIQVQRDTAMPHASPQLDWELARAVTTRLLAAAPEVYFSYARQKESTEVRPSRIVSQLAGVPQPLPAELAAPNAPHPLTIAFDDFSRIPFPYSAAEGGANVLTFQSQCPFKAFATIRLGAKGWEAAQAGLTPSERGRLIHAMLHAVWAGPPHGIRTLDELARLQDRHGFVAGVVRRVWHEELSAAARERMPRRYLAIEQRRLTDLVSAWLEYERTRRDFTVAATEVNGEAAIAGLMVKVRLDRVDRLNDDTMLVIDYKTGTVSPRSWDLPRPDDVQLPLYAAFALDRDKEPLGGLVFAKVQAGENKRAFDGCVFQPAATLFDGLKGTSSLIRNALTLEQLLEWREHIEQLARDFLAGRAEADPREYPKTCERCELPVLCRIHENRAGTGAGEDYASEEAADE
jgi:ATP-dependent helicase/nuclease subunit B